MGSSSAIATPSLLFVAIEVSIHMRCERMRLIVQIKPRAIGASTRPLTTFTVISNR
jgi:hypothetical protein